ncbi:MAG: hypothetical protein WCD76_16990, partial [Pyrinomonadaceae bacterium]
DTGADTSPEGVEAGSKATTAKARAADKKESARTGASRGARGATSKNRTARRTPAESSTPEVSGRENSPADNSERAAETTPANTSKPVGARTSKTPRAARNSRQPGKSSTATKRSDSAATTDTPIVAPQLPAAGQRLIIITKGGDIIQRDMNTVRRVTVENNGVVILLLDGKVIRQPLANILRMSIEP